MNDRNGSDASGPDQGTGGAGSEVRALTQAVAEAVKRGRTAGARSGIDAVEAAGAALVQRVVDAAIAEPRDVPDHRRLVKALRQRSGGAGFGGTAAMGVASRVARRLGPARFVARRSPLWLAVTAVPAIYSSIGRGAEELSLVASHLVLRARATGVEPDRERLRRVVVQVLTGRPIRPDQDPSHGPLAFGWARRAVRSALPFTSGVKTRDPEGIASAAAEVDPSVLTSR